MLWGILSWCGGGIGSVRTVVGVKLLLMLLLLQLLLLLLLMLLLL